MAYIIQQFLNFSNFKSAFSSFYYFCQSRMAHTRVFIVNSPFFFAWTRKRYDIQFLSNVKKEGSNVYLFIFFFILFRLNVAFNNLSAISRRHLDVTGSSMLTLRVLPHRHITPQTHDVTFHAVALYWHRTDHFRFFNAERKRNGS